MDELSLRSLLPLSCAENVGDAGRVVRVGSFRRSYRQHDDGKGSVARALAHKNSRGRDLAKGSVTKLLGKTSVGWLIRTLGG